MQQILGPSPSMEAIDNNRFFYVSQWESWFPPTLLRIPFVHIYLQLAPEEQIPGPLGYG